MKSQYIICISFVYLQITLPSHAEIVTTESPDPVATETSDLGIIPSDPLIYGDINQQGGIINNGFQAVNCGNACFYSYFEINKLQTFSGENIETKLGVGINVPLSNANSSLTQAQADQIKNQDAHTYIDALNTACQAKNFFAVELNARGLARIWGINYQTFVSSCWEYHAKP